MQGMNGLNDIMSLMGNKPDMSMGSPGRGSSPVSDEDLFGSIMRSGMREIHDKTSSLHKSDVPDKSHDETGPSISDNMPEHNGKGLRTAGDKSRDAAPSDKLKRPDKPKVDRESDEDGTDKQITSEDMQNLLNLLLEILNASGNGQSVESSGGESPGVSGQTVQQLVELLNQLRNGEVSMSEARESLKGSQASEIFDLLAEMVGGESSGKTTGQTAAINQILDMLSSADVQASDDILGDDEVSPDRIKALLAGNRESKDDQVLEKAESHNDDDGLKKNIPLQGKADPVLEKAESHNDDELKKNISLQGKADISDIPEDAGKEDEGDNLHKPVTGTRVQDESKGSQAISAMTTQTEDSGVIQDRAGSSQGAAVMTASSVIAANINHSASTNKFSDQISVDSFAVNTSSDQPDTGLVHHGSTFISSTRAVENIFTGNSSKMTLNNDLLDKIVYVVKGNSKMGVTLEHQTLGKINLNVSIEKGMVNVHVHAPDNAAKNFMENNMQYIVDALDRDGVSVGEFSVGLKGGDREGPGWSGGQMSDSDKEVLPVISTVNSSSMVSIYA